jgi:hypothetical protein
VLTGLAAMLANGGETMSDISALTDQPRLHGPVASGTTAWRALAGLDASGTRLLVILQPVGLGGLSGTQHGAWCWRCSRSRDNTPGHSAPHLPGTMIAVPIPYGS